MYDKPSQNFNRLRGVLRYGATAHFALFGFSKNRTSYSERSPLIHSYGYESADDRTDYLALIRLPSEPFMNYPGQWSRIPPVRMTISQSGSVRVNQRLPTPYYGAERLHGALVS